MNLFRREFSVHRLETTFDEVLICDRAMRELEENFWNMLIFSNFREKYSFSFIPENANF